MTMRAADRIPDQALLLIVTRGLSSIAAAMLAFGLDVWICRKTGSYALFAYFSMLFALPNVLLAPIAGVWVDRHGKKAILLACEAASLISMLLVAWRYFGYALDLYSVAAATLMLSMASNVRWIAMGVAISILVPPSALSRVNALQQAFEGAMMISGPMLGAVALAYFGLGATIVLAFAGSLVALISLGLITVERPGSQPYPQAARQHLRDELGFGFRWIWREPALRRLLLFVVGYNFASGLFTTTSTPYLLSFASSQVLGGSLALEGIGAMLMGVVLTRWSDVVPPERRIVLAAAMFGGLMLAWGVTRATAPVLALSFVAGTLTTMLIAALQTTWQRSVPVAIQGRVFAARRMLSSLLLPVSTLLSIPASERIFQPLLHAWPPAGAVWGKGQAGTLGLMLSTLGVALLAGCVAYHLRGGLYAIPSLKKLSQPLDADNSL